MNHDQYKEWLQLLMYDELTADEHALLDQHLGHCSECREEVEELKRFHALLLQAEPVSPDERLLRDARRELHTTLHTRRTRQPLWNRAAHLVTEFILPNYKVALGGLAMLGVGILLGRLVFIPGQHIPIPPTSSADKASTFLDGETRIANVRFVNSDVSGSEVELTFDAVSPVHIKGNINDDRVQKVLAHALVNDQNPGVRLRSASVFSTQVQKLRMPDKDVKVALILALKTDDNPGVRKEALKALLSFPFDEEVKRAFLHVLMHDKNPALRIAAINSLDSARVQGQPGDGDLLEVLKQRMQSDDNNYVRIRSKAVLEEVQQQ
jgi:hypothetical protein